jgi:hypothetical protein
MVDVEKHRAPTEIQEGAQGNHAESHLSAELARAMSSRPPVEGRALMQMHKRTDAQKSGLSSQELSTVQFMEGQMINGDPKATADVMQLNYNHGPGGRQPGDLKPMMDTMAKDLAAVGIKAKFDYTSKINGKSDDYYELGHNDVGHLRLTREGDGRATELDIRSDGTMKVSSRGRESVQGTEAPAGALKYILDGALKRD